MPGTRKLGRDTAHRTAMLRAMVTFLKLLSEAAVEIRGNYVLYASGNYAQQWRKDFLDLIK